MRKFFARSLCVVMALVMVLSMSASAQSTRMSVKVEMPQGAFDAALITGFDADGCEQFIFDSAAFGKILLQSDGMNLTVGSEDGGYITVSAQALREALTAVMYALTSELPIKNIFDIVNYITGPQYAADTEALSQVMAGEANRFANVAMNMGLVTMSDAGDLAIEATFEKMNLLFAGYLKSLSQDTATIAKVTNLGIFEVLEAGLAGSEEMIAQILASAAQEMEAGASYAQDGGLKLYIYAAGTMDGEIYMVDSGLTAKFEMHYNASGMSMAVSAVEGANLAKIALSENNSGLTFTVDYSAEGDLVDVDVVMNAEGINATGIIDTEMLKGEGKFVCAGGKTVFNGQATDGFSTVNMEGNLDENAGKYFINYEMNNKRTNEKFVLDSYGNEMLIENVVTESGSIIKNFKVVRTEKNGSYIFTVDYAEGREFIDAEIVAGAEGMTATGSFNISGFKGEGEYEANANKTVFDGEVTDGYSTVKVEYDLDNANGEYEFEYKMNNRYTTEKLVIEYTDGELYIENTVTESGETVKNVIITGSKNYRVNAAWEDSSTEYTLTGTLRTKEGLTFEGDLSVESKYGMGINADFEIEASYVNGAFDADVTVDAGNGNVAEVSVSCGNGEMVFEIQPETDGEDRGCMIAKLAKTAAGLTGEFKYEEIYDGELDEALEASFSLDANGLTANAEVKQDDEIIPASLVIKDGLVEANMTVEGMVIKAVYEYAIANDILNINAFITYAAEGASEVIEVYKYLLNMDLNSFVHNLYVKSIADNSMYQSTFDGETYTFVYDMDGEKIELTGKHIYEANNNYILLEGTVQGMPMTAKIGIKTVSENEKRIYAEAEAAGETVGAAIVMNTVQTNSSVGTTYTAEISQNGAVQTLGSINFTMEVLPENLQHVDGQEVTAEQLAQLIVGMLQSMMY